MQKLLIIGYTWPEPKTTGAGVRMMELIQAFLKYKYQITFVSAAEKTVHSEDLFKLGIQEQSVQLNDAAFDDLIKTFKPDVVLFDRFYTEEQFGWRITEHCPDAIKILDTEDLHFLRFAREKALKDNAPLNYKNSDITVREIASIYRCDLSLIISRVEIELLIQEFKIEDTLLYYLPFIPKPIKKESLPGFKQRNHFIFIGNYRHRPNVDAVLQLKNSIWPLISKKIPNAKLYCFGAYAGSQINQLHKPEERFHIAGWTNDAKHVIQNSRVLLAPLRFGAGLKGKIIDAMQYGTPFVTSTIGIEGLDDFMNQRNVVADEINSFSENAIRLYKDENLWNECQKMNFQVLNNHFINQKIESSFFTKINELITTIKTHRSNNFIGTMLLHHQFQSTKYLSKWIEEKNKN